MKESFFDEKNQLPLVIEPSNPSKRSKADLLNWIKENEKVLTDSITKYGALLFRGFDLDTPQDFEDVSLAIDKDLKNDYLGTSPRNARTKYSFSASELPGHYPIMQHCEMSFLAKPPKKLFFYCHVEPQGGGETPVTDFRKVIAQMNPEIKKEFQEKGIRTIRNYDGPNKKSALKLFQLKKWNEIFNTTDREEVEKKCKDYGIKIEWQSNNGLRMINEQPATIKHPKTNEEVWFNHLQVFHAEAAAIEYRKIVKFHGRLVEHLTNTLLNSFTALKRIFAPSDKYSMHVTFLDGTEIPKKYVQHVEDLIWNNISVFSWKLKDMLVIDNFSTSHGRLPYSGPRDILVCWAED